MICALWTLKYKHNDLQAPYTLAWPKKFSRTERLLYRRKYTALVSLKYIVFYRIASPKKTKAYDYTTFSESPRAGWTPWKSIAKALGAEK